MPILKKVVKGKGYMKATNHNVDRDHSNDPFIVKKVEEAKAFLHKNGLPDHLKK
jgi:hypothetical protein